MSMTGVSEIKGSGSSTTSTPVLPVSASGSYQQVASEFISLSLIMAPEFSRMTPLFLRTRSESTLKRLYEFDEEISDNKTLEAKKLVLTKNMEQYEALCKKFVADLNEESESATPQRQLEIDNLREPRLIVLNNLRRYRETQ